MSAGRAVVPGAMLGRHFTVGLLLIIKHGVYLLNVGGFVRGFPDILIAGSYYQSVQFRERFSAVDLACPVPCLNPGSLLG